MQLFEKTYSNIRQYSRRFRQRPRRCFAVYKLTKLTRARVLLKCRSLQHKASQAICACETPIGSACEPPIKARVKPRALRV